MNSSKLCSLFLGLILISQSPLVAKAKSHDDLISEICNSSSDKKTCTDILESNSKAAKAKNYEQMSKVVLEMAYDKAAEGQNFLKSLAQSTNCPTLTECAHFDYDTAVLSFKSALGELEEDPQTANYDAKVAGDGPAQCDRGMANAQVVNADVTALNREISLYSEIAFLATNNL